MGPWSLAILLLSLWCGFVDANETEDLPCPCRYEKQNEGECLSYSRSLSGELKGWTVADDTCLATLGIEERILSNDIFWAFCPFPNRTGVNYSEIVSFLRGKPDHPIAVEIKALYADKQIFVQEGNNYVLADEMFTGNQQHIDCKETPNLCWSQIRVDLEGRKKKMNSLCATLHERQVIAWKTEQGKARLRLCQETVASCEPLASKVMEEKPFGDDCSNYGSIVANDDLPVCEEEDKGSSGTETMSIVVSMVLVTIPFLIL